MGDLFTELLVKKERTPKDSLIKYGLIALTALCVFGALFIHYLLLIPAVGLFVADYFILPRTDVEYEYLYINGDFDIDMIMSKSKRKRVCSFSLQEADIAAPLNSHRMDYYNNNQKLKTLDYSSGNPDHKRFAVISRVKEEASRIIIEPDQDLIEKMKKTAPGKVFLD